MKLFFPLMSVMAIAALVTFWPGHRSVSSSASPPASKSAAGESSSVQTADSEVAIAPDRLRHPPIRQTFTAGSYQLVITAQDREWETPVATAQLSDGDRLLWQQELPHEYGPRFVLVSPRGQVLLLDEFINVASPYALTLIDQSGEVVAQNSFEDVQKTLQVSLAVLTEQANSGWWISAPPTLGEATHETAHETANSSAPAQDLYARVKAGGTTLEIDLSTGELSHPTDL